MSARGRHPRARARRARRGLRHGASRPRRLPCPRIPLSRTRHRLRPRSQGRRRAPRAGTQWKLADATDSDFWETICPSDGLDLAVLAMPTHAANVHAVETLRRHGFQGAVAVAGKFSEDIRELRGLGIDTAFDLYSKAGASFAGHVINVFTQQRPDLAKEWRTPLDRD